MCCLVDWLLLVAPGLPESVEEFSLDEGTEGHDARGCCLLRAAAGSSDHPDSSSVGQQIYVSCLLHRANHPKLSGFKHNGHTCI